MTPEIKAAIENNSHEYCQNTRFVNLSTDCPTIEQLVIDANKAGAEYGYKLGKERYDLAVKALKYIANSTPSPDQTFEIENKLAAQKALKELGE